MIRSLLAVVLVAAFVPACSTDATVGESRPETSADAGTDTGSDVGSDVAIDTALGDAGTDAASAAIAEACTKLATARCTQMKRCEPYFLATRYADDATCVTRETLWCTTFATAPDTGVTVSGITSCASTLSGGTCLEWLNGMPMPACRFGGGTRKDDEPCFHDGQCLSGACSMGINSACGRCLPRASVGGACSIGTPISVCEPGSTCESSKCVRLAKVGESCDQYGPVHCLVGLTCVAGTCAANLTTVGATCAMKYAPDPTAPECDEALGYSCDAGKCVKTPLLADGDACSFGDPAMCKAPTACGTSKCVPRKDDGASCSMGNACTLPAVCAMSGGSGTCTIPSGTACK